LYNVCYIDDQDELEVHKSDGITGYSSLETINNTHVWGQYSVLTSENHTEYIYPREDNIEYTSPKKLQSTYVW